MNPQPRSRLGPSAKKKQQTNGVLKKQESNATKKKQESNGTKKKQESNGTKKKQESNGSKFVRFKPTSTTVKSEVEPIEDTHLRLLEWAKDMGFAPHGKFTKTSDYPSVDDMKKLCRRETKPVWEHIMKCVRPAAEVADVRRALADRRRRQRTDSSDGLIGKSDLALRRESLERELETKRVAAAGAETRLASLLDAFDNQLLEMESLQHGVDRDALKVNLLWLQAEEVEQQVSLTGEYVDTARALLAALRRGGGEGAGETEAARRAKTMSGLRECLSLLAALHDRTYALNHASPDLTVDMSRPDKRRLQRAVRDVGVTTRGSARDIWGAMAALGDEMCARARETRYATLEEEERDAELEIADAEAELRRLEAAYVELTERTKAVEEECRTLTLSGEDAFQECWAMMEEQLAMPANLDQSTAVDSDLVEEWLDSTLMCARLEASTREARRLLQQLRTDTDRLDEDNLRHEATMLELRDRRQTMGVMEHRMDYFTRLYESLVRDVHAVRTQVCHAVSATTLADAVRTTGGLVARTEGVAGEEAAEFARLPLEAIDRVKLPSGTMTLRSNLLTNYVQALPRLLTDASATDMFRCLGGAPLSAVEDVALALHDRNRYGARLRAALTERRPLETIPLYEAGAFRKHETRENARAWATVSDVKYRARRTSDAIEAVADAARIYRDHPIQRAVPDGATAGGLTLAQWGNKYDEIHAKLTHAR